MTTNPVRSKVVAATLGAAIAHQISALALATGVDITGEIDSAAEWAVAALDTWAPIIGAFLGGYLKIETEAPAT
jgi:hypothetical protein